MNNKYLLIVLFFISFALRFVFLGQVPPHLNWDEVSHGYNAYSILTTGKDEWGEPYPDIFRGYGDYKLPIYIYSVVPFIAINGMNPISVRLPSVIAGSLIVVFTFLLVNYLFKNKKVALLSAVLVAVEPWSLFLSRVAVEANFALMLIVSGVYFLIRGIEERRDLSVLGFLLLSLSMWTYNSARIFAPLIVLSILFIYRVKIIKYWKRERTALILGILLFVTFLAPVVGQLVSGEGSARYSKVQIIDEGAINTILVNRENSNLPALLSRLVHNKYVYLATTAISNYFSVFNIDFLYDNGGSNYQFNVPDDGVLYSVNFVMLVFGVVYLIKSNRHPKKILLLWIILAPIASSVTRENPHTLRNIVLLPVPMVLSALGMYFVFSRFKKYSVLLAIVYFSVVCLEFSDYFHNYLNSYKTNYSWSWQYGYEQAVEKIAENYDKYDKIIFTKKYGEPHEFMLFYGAVHNSPWPWAADEFRNDPNLVRFSQSDWFWVDRFGKFYFMNDWQIPKSGTDMWALESGSEIPVDEGSVYLVTSPGNYPKNWKYKESINFLNGEPAFDIVVKI